MNNTCDVVMEGGGVRGIGLVGALSALDDAKYSFRRVAGVSAGAIVGSLVASGLNATELKKIMATINYKAFRDEGWIDRLGLPGKGVSLLFERGIYEGDYLRDWISKQLAAVGIKTFADLKITADWAKKLPAERRYKLVVLASDITRGRLVRLPWDYKEYGLNPDTQNVADAVRASMSIPFFYEPARLSNSYLVDGALLSNFPITIFDDTPDIPTIGMKLSTKEEALHTINPADTPQDFVKAILETMLGAHDAMHLDNPRTIRRTIFIDTSTIKTTNFDITAEQQQFLFDNGLAGGKKFLASWDYAKFKKEFPEA